MNLQKNMFSEVNEEVFMILWEFSQRCTKENNSVASLWTLCNKLIPWKFGSVVARGYLVTFHYGFPISTYPTSIDSFHSSHTYFHPSLLKLTHCIYIHHKGI